MLVLGIEWHFSEFCGYLEWNVSSSPAFAIGQFPFEHLFRFKFKKRIKWFISSQTTQQTSQWREWVFYRSIPGLSGVFLRYTLPHVINTNTYCWIIVESETPLSFHGAHSGSLVSGHLLISCPSVSLPVKWMRIATTCFSQMWWGLTSHLTVRVQQSINKCLLKASSVIFSALRKQPWIRYLKIPICIQLIF